MTLRAWLREGPFSLAMSSGFFGFFAHCGVMTVLEEEGLLPRRMSGSSAGALVTGAWASGLDAALLAQELLALERSHFWDPRPGLGILAGRRFRARLESLLPRSTFESCRVPVAVSTFDVRTRKTHVIDRGPLAPAIQASCAVPVMFHPVSHANRWLLDGGILDRPGLEGMPAGERVLFHHLVSRSPWSSRERMEIPWRTNMTTLVIGGLPRSGPFALEAGKRAYELARAAARRALDRPLSDVVRV